MTLPDPGEQARRFIKVREAHRSEVQQDYVELIADLVAARGVARVVDLAERFGVTTATVANTLARLKRDGLVEDRPYRSLCLTAAGTAMAEASRARHDIVVAFLLRLGVSRAVAELDAEGLEHHLSAETLAAMEGFAG
ncbi:manganese-binding transcriptional regulator MntR [Sphingomonas montana]|uniref:manganese-binding transcriptional regulator MntR n=1 Tax=Sphingomonas montana TaxID=1843236 RepID=UPI00096D5571|nr:manganese-binding transcriptional regulator MntR [Sphingomonas montana]